ncbi:MAG: serine hydrolase [Cyanobacteria bacterium J06648_10]
MNVPQLLRKKTSTAAFGLLTMTVAGCTLQGPSLPPEAVTTQQPVNNNSPESAQGENNSSLFRFHHDSTTLEGLLAQQNLLGTMTEWKGQMLLVSIDETQSPQSFRSYSLHSIYQDSNQNGVQDPDDLGFFNPASTVKVPIASLVLETLAQQGLTRQAEYRQAATRRWYSFEDDIRRALVISDNEATNRLILWLGFDEINKRLAEKGFSHIAINRLMLDRGTLIPSPAFEIRFNEEIIQKAEQPVTIEATCYETKDKVGNCASAHDLLQGLIQLNQPDYFNLDMGFELSSTDREWLQTVMSRTPKEEGFDYADDYCRFLTEVENRWASNSGKMLSKCGVSLFTNTYTDLSYIETDAGEKYYLLLSLSPPRRTSELTIIRYMNQVASTVLSAPL